MTYDSGDNRIDYFPPIAGNGSVLISVGCDGTMLPIVNRAKSGVSPDNLIWWAGRRFNDTGKPLAPFGFFSGDAGVPSHWRQTLDTTRGVVSTECDYVAGSAAAETFVHHDHNIIAMRKNFVGGGEYTFSYTFGGKDGILPKRFRITGATYDDGFAVDYTLDGYHEYCGRILVFSDAKVSHEQSGNKFILKTDASVKSAAFYIILDDDFSGEGYIGRLAELKKRVLELGFDGLKREHGEKWSEFMREGGADFGDTALDSAYKAAVYSIKCQTTPWSIPVGLNNAYWQGRYFAFDEYFSYYALLTGNHKALARRVPEFRYAGLGVARERATYVSRPQARYPWETLEDGCEAGPPGVWWDHIFHMAHVVYDVYEYYKYTGDAGFLSDKIQAVICCAAFFIDHMTYKIEGGKTVIGKCTDLERLGASVQNAYMTTCSVIKALRYTSEALRVLGIESAFAQECSVTAEELFLGLPDDGEKYCVYPGCEQKSIGVFTGSFPYRAVGRDSALQKNAMADFAKSENRYGNCYATGKGVSTWYAAIKAAGYANIDLEDESYSSLRQALANCGCFGECFEINEKENLMYRPWFTTAAGTLVSAVNTMLLRREGENVYICPAFGKNCRDLSFRLALEGGGTVGAVVKDGALTSLDYSGGEALKFVLNENLTDATSLCRRA